MKTRLRILFVDDEPNVLKGLKRSMHEMDEEWEMYFCDSGAAALTLLEQTSMDVVVSDMRMPNLDGACLLDTIRCLYPQTIRIILSGYAEAESVLRTVAPAHIYMAKPCHPDRLRSTITRTVALRHHLTDPSLLAVIGGIYSLPSLPLAYHGLLKELEHADCPAERIAGILSQDIAMTAGILKLTNSAFFALNSNISAITQGVKTLGLEVIRTLVLQFSFFRPACDTQISPALLHNLTCHSLQRAGLAEKIASAMGLSEAICKASYFAAMLSAIGVLALLDQDGERYRHCLSLVDETVALSAVEQQVYGTTSSHIGGYLLGLWGFSDPICEAVAFSACPATASAPDSPVLLVVHLASTLSPGLPLLPAGFVGSTEPDLDFLISKQQDGLLSRWRELAAAHFGEKKRWANEF